MGKPLTIDLDEDLMLCLQQQAEAQGMPLERLVTEALQRLIRVQEEKQRIIDEAWRKPRKAALSPPRPCTAGWHHGTPTMSCRHRYRMSSSSGKAPHAHHIPAFRAR